MIKNNKNHCPHADHILVVGGRKQTIKSKSYSVMISATEETKQVKAGMKRCVKGVGSRKFSLP